VLVKALSEVSEPWIIDQRHDPAFKIDRAKLQNRIDRLNCGAGEKANGEKAENQTNRDIENGAAKHESILPQSRNVFNFILKRPKSM
jgi:hypothetical protein